MMDLDIIIYVKLILSREYTMKTIAITGATGQIGYALTFQLMHMFHDDHIHLKLIDMPNQSEKLEAMKMELEDCAFKNLSNVTITDDLEVGFKDVDWALLVGSMPRKAGMERADLLKLNGAIFKDQGKVINQVAKHSVKVLVVGNPCNTNALIACHHAPDIPDQQFFALTMLDQLRAQSQIALKAGVHVNQVKDMIIFGNHSATQFPAYEFVEIDDQKVIDIISDHDWFDHQFVPTVQKRGAHVIKVRGGSSAASAANAVCETVRRVDHSDHLPFSLGVMSKGEYGAHPGLIVSYPCISNHGRITIQDQWPISDKAKAYLTKTFDELKAEYDLIQRLGLID